MVKRSMQRRRNQSAQRARTRSARRSARRSRMGGKRTRDRSARRSRRGGMCPAFDFECTKRQIQDAVDKANNEFAKGR